MCLSYEYSDHNTLHSSGECADDHDHMALSFSGEYADDSNMPMSAIFDPENYESDHESEQRDCYMSSSDNSTNNAGSDTSGHEEDNDSMTSDYPFLTEPLYKDSSITVGETIIAVMQFCLNNHLTYKATDDLLKLLQVLCVTPNKLPKSEYLLKKFFRSFKRSEYNYTKVCANCKKDASDCSCGDPSHGDLIAVSIEKPLQAIVSSKCHVHNCILV